MNYNIQEQSEIEGNMKSSGSTKIEMTADLEQVNALVEKLLELKEKRNNFILDFVGSVESPTFKRADAAMKAEIAELEYELIETDKRLAEKYQEYRVVSPDSPSMLEPRTFK